MSFPEPTQWNGADMREMPSSDGTPVRYRCAKCDWRGKGSIARAEHWKQTAHVVLPADDPRFFVTICAWCDGSVERTAQLTAQGRKVTHGICDIHRAEFEAGR